MLIFKFRVFRDALLSLAYLKEDIGHKSEEQNSINIEPKTDNDAIEDEKDEILKNLEESGETVTSYQSLKKIINKLIEDKKPGRYYKYRDCIEILESYLLPYPLKGSIPASEMNYAEKIDHGKSPIQIFPESHESEVLLWDMLCGEIEELMKEVMGFYCHCNNTIGDSKRAQYPSKGIVEKTLKNYFKNNSIDVKVEEKDFEDLNDSSLPFYFNAKITPKNSPNSKSLMLSIFVPPTWKELEINSHNARKRKILKKHKELNKAWLKEGNAGLESRDPEKMHGETQKEEVDSNEIEVIDFLIDRIAARAQSLIYSLPIGDFTTEDAHMLSWAALEVGKLVEREISYRASRFKNSIPLTAMEFYRAPISDLSFADELNRMYEKTERIKSNIDHHVKNLFYTEKMQNTVRYSSRIKKHNSYLSRLGERHDGFTRGNLAIWLFLISLLDEESSVILSDDLRKFGDSIEKAICHARGGDAVLNEDNLNRTKAFFKKYHNQIIGDMCFNTGPLFETSDPKVLKKMGNPLLNNLFNEGIIKEKYNYENDSLLSDENHSFKCAIFELIYRNYDSYTIASTSLLLQIHNRLQILENFDKEHMQNFSIFYKFCCSLKALLSVSPREAADQPSKRYLTEIFGGGDQSSRFHGKDKAWKRIIEFISKHPTSKVTGNEKDDSSYAVYLDFGGLYKRLRTTLNVFKKQRSPENLNWELNRFDFLGCRINCLYKNQVFSLYEQIWNIGDPFFSYRVSRPSNEINKLSDFVVTDNPDRESNSIAGITKRNRWLCLRTKTFDDSYRAMHVSALADPQAIEYDFWSKPGYNLKKVQQLMGALFAEFESEAPVKAYQSFAMKRNRIRKFYNDWYQLADNIAEIPSDNPEELEKKLWFGSYLGQGVIHFINSMISSIIEANNKACKISRIEGKVRLEFENNIQSERIFLDNPQNEPFVGTVEELLNKHFIGNKNVLDAFRNMINIGKKYSKGVIQSFEQDGKEIVVELKDNYDDFISSTESLYTKTIEFLEDLSQQIDTISIENNSISIDIVLSMFNNGNIINIDNKKEIVIDKIQSEKCYLEKEKKHFLEVLENNKDDKTIKSHYPILYLAETFPAQGPSGINNPQSTKEYFHAWRGCLKKYRNEQRDYLFFRKNNAETTNITARSNDEVLNRIQNYSLLFDPTSTKNSSDNKYAGWTAYDLFYYLRTLVPIEFQIRTELANTLAEQYHDTIYKGRRAPLEIDFPRSNMEKAGVGLHGWDVEMEGDFEYFINRYYFNQYILTKKDEQINENGSKD